MMLSPTCFMQGIKDNIDEKDVDTNNNKSIG